MIANLGFRSAPPQALRHRRAPRAKANPTDDEPCFAVSGNRDTTDRLMKQRQLYFAVSQLEAVHPAFQFLLRLAPVALF